MLIRAIRVEPRSLFRICAPAVEFTVMLMAEVAHERGPIEHALVVHLDRRRPARHDELLFVAGGDIESAGVTHRRQTLGQRRRFFPGVGIEEIFQLQLALVGDLIIPEHRHGLRRHQQLLGAMARERFIGLKAAIAARLAAE